MNLPPATPDLMMEAMRASMPNLKTQAQFTAFMAAFDSLRLVCDAIFSGDPEREKQAREVLDKALYAARVSTEIGQKFQEVPESSRGPASNPFVNPPSEFHEYDLQKRLLAELEGLQTMADLKEWYDRTKEDRDRVVSQNLRNVLIDSIREKKASFT